MLLRFVYTLTNTDHFKAIITVSYIENRQHLQVVTCVFFYVLTRSLCMLLHFFNETSPNFIILTSLKKYFYLTLKTFLMLIFVFKFKGALAVKFMFTDLTQILIFDL